MTTVIIGKACHAGPPMGWPQSVSIIIGAIAGAAIICTFLVMLLRE